jgi:hypothetical protein
MPPRSTKSKEVQGEVVPSSRRSSRLAPPTNISAESKGTGAKEKGNKKVYTRFPDSNDEGKSADDIEISRCG